jgi:hypothetical protein
MEEQPDVCGARRLSSLSGLCPNLLLRLFMVQSGIEPVLDRPLANG